MLHQENADIWALSGHIQKLAEAEKEGLKKAGIEADLFQVPETLPQEILTKVALSLANVDSCRY